MGGGQIMTPTQTWELCVIITIAIFMVLSAVWGKKYKDRRNNDTDK